MFSFRLWCPHRFFFLSIQKYFELNWGWCKIRSSFNLFTCLTVCFQFSLTNKLTLRKQTPGILSSWNYGKTNNTLCFRYLFSKREDNTLRTCVHLESPKTDIEPSTNEFSESSTYMFLCITPWRWLLTDLFIGLFASFYGHFSMIIQK